MRKTSALALFVLSLSACGGNEPFSLVLQDPVINDSTGLSLPVPQGVIASLVPFSSSHDGIGIAYGAFSTQVVAAPLSGTVTQVDTTSNPGFTNVTIYHNPRLTSRLSFLQIASVRVGDFVNTSDQLGTLSNSGLTGIKLSVFIDGSATAVCPLSYLTSAARQVYIGYPQTPCTN